MTLSLNSKIDWVTLLRALNVEPQARYLPTTANCPICKQGRLRLIQDNCQIGAWFVCRHCKHFGDMLDLTSFSLRCSDVVAAHRLQEFNALSAIPKLADALTERRKFISDPTRRLAGMWLEASRQGRVIVDLQAQLLTNKLRLNIDPSISWAAQGAGQLLGFLDADQIEDYLRPRRETSPRRHQPRERKILPKNANTALIIPFYDVPGRICSCRLIYADGPEKRWQTIDYLTGIGRHINWSEGGIALHPAALDNDIDGQILATSDFELYLRMACRHSAYCPTPLPLVCYCDGNHPTRSWQLLGNRKVTFWAPSVTPQLLWQAIRLDAKISTRASRVLSPREYLANRDCLVTVQKCLNLAKPWPVAVAAIAENKHQEELADWFARADLNDAERRLVVESCPLRLRSKLKRALQSSLVYKTVIAGDNYVEQRNNGWYAVKPEQQEQLITDTPFWIQQAVSSGDKPKQIHYKVNAKYRGQTFEFMTDAIAMHKDAFEVVRRQATLAGVGVPACDPRWRRQAINLSLQFHQPTVIVSLDRIGYRAVDNSYNLPSATINTLTGRWRTINAGNDNLPAANLPLDMPLEDAADILRDRSQQPIIALLLGVYCQILCDIAGKPQPTIMLSTAAGRLAAAQLAKLLNFKQTSKIHIPSTWPVLNSADLKSFKPTTKSTLSREDWPGIIAVTYPQLAYGLLTSNNLWIQTGKFKRIPKVDLRPLAKLLIEAVAYACQHKFHWEFGNTTSTLDGAKELFMQFLATNQLPMIYPRKAARWCYQRDDVGKQLISAIGVLITTGHLTLRKFKDRNKYEPGAIYWQTSTDHVFVSVREVHNAFIAANCSRFNFMRLLLEIGCAEYSPNLIIINGRQCWQFDKQLLDREVNIRQQFKGGLIKIAS